MAKMPSTDPLVKKRCKDALEFALSAASLLGRYVEDGEIHDYETVSEFLGDLATDLRKATEWLTEASDHTFTE